MNDLVDARVLGAAVLGGALGYFVSQHARPRPRASHQAVHVLLCEFGFANKADRDSFTNSWAPLAARVLRDEPNCLSYEMCNDNSDETKVIIYERYVSKRDLDGAHQQSLAEHKKTAVMGAAPQSKKFTHFTETNIGHMDR